MGLRPLGGNGERQQDVEEDPPLARTQKRGTSVIVCFSDFVSHDEVACT